MEAADPYIGQTVKGTYFIQRRVGGGGMGDVYKAVHVALDKPVALKLLKKSLLADATLVQRFYREARAASKLRHPNVISVTDFGQTEDGTLFMAMEYLAGKNLARVIADEQPLSERRIVRIGAQVLAALAEAHAAGILHRDLKPENVMIESRRDEPDSVKVLDFGIAKIQTAEADADKSQAALTQAGLVCGTPGYMSPEQWGEETLDTRSDLYAAGVLLYEMLTGKLPFEAATPWELARKQRSERPQPPSARRADRAVSDPLERLVMRALSPDREDRPASAEEMRSDLVSCVLSPNPEAPGAAGDGDAKENETVAFYRLPVRRVPSPPPSPRRTPGQGTGLRTPPKQTRASTPPKENRPRNPALPRPPATPSGANLPRARDGSAEAATIAAAIPSLKPQRVGLVAGAIAGAVALAMALVIAQWPRRNSASTPDAGPAATPSPTPKPTLAPWLNSPLEPVATPAPSLPASEATPAPEPAPTSKPDIPPATPAAALAPKLPRAQCASPLHYEHGLGKISTPTPASGEGVLVVRALPRGQVFVCASAYGEAPVELKVKAGTYQVRVDHGATSKRSQVVVEPGSRAVVAEDFSRTK